MNAQSVDRCPRCGEERLRTWQELSDEEQVIVRRLPDSANHSLAERQARHRWCTRCWYESSADREWRV